MKDAYSWIMFEEEQIQLVRMASGNFACVTFDYEQAGNEHCFSLKSSNNREFMQMKIDYQTEMKIYIRQSKYIPVSTSTQSTIFELFTTFVR